VERIVPGARVLVVEILDKLLAIGTVPDLHAWVDAEGSSYPAYNVSKEAAILVVKRLAPQPWSEYGIGINVVSPGPAETAILPDFEATMGKEFLDSVSATVGRHARVVDVVPVIPFLSSPAAGWVIGQDIHVDAGFTSSLVSAAL
jgi:NAD(P)-dependent dehydrogenase (short-subunit alcohol dehydrogenase family)